MTAIDIIYFTVIIPSPNYKTLCFKQYTKLRLEFDLRSRREGVIMAR